MTKPRPKTRAPVATLPLAGDRAAALRRLNRWRDRNNPLRGLTIAGAISKLDDAQAGIFADAQWAYQLIERRDEDLIAVIESTSAALLQLNWYVRTCDGDPRRAAQWDEKLAADQAAVLLDHYNRCENLYDALEHLALATFRGYAHVQVRADGDWLTSLEKLDQWNVARDGHHGDWWWNPEARNVPVSSLDPAHRLDPSAYLIVETPRPVDEVAIVKYLRSSMSAKDWDAYLEIYGIPGWIVTLPPNVPAGREDEYRDAAAAVAEGGSGSLPNGSTANAAAYPSGEPPFRAHMEWWSQRLVLAATGGLLTSVALPTGLGSGASDEHAATFGRIARGRARRISEQFQRKVDRELLDAAFPGAPHLAYFEFDAREETDLGEIVGQIVQLGAAGLRVDPAQVEERTGYRVTLAEPAAPAPSAAPASPTPADPKTAAVEGDIQSAALNGAQVQSLQSIITDVANKLLPPGAAVEMLVAAFPLLPRDRVEAMVRMASEFTPAPSNGQPVASRAEAPESPRQGGGDTWTPADTSKSPDPPMQGVAKAVQDDNGSLAAAWGASYGDLAQKAADLAKIEDPAALAAAASELLGSLPDAPASDAVAEALEAVLAEALARDLSATLKEAQA